MMNTRHIALGVLLALLFTAACWAIDANTSFAAISLVPVMALALGLYATYRLIAEVVASWIPAKDGSVNIRGNK